MALNIVFDNTEDIVYLDDGHVKIGFRKLDHVEYIDFSKVQWTDNVNNLNRLLNGERDLKVECASFGGTTEFTITSDNTFQLLYCSPCDDLINTFRITFNYTDNKSVIDDFLRYITPENGDGDGDSEID